VTVTVSEINRVGTAYKIDEPMLARLLAHMPVESTIDREYHAANIVLAIHSNRKRSSK